MQYIYCILMSIRSTSLSTFDILDVFTFGTYSRYIYVPFTHKIALPNKIRGRYHEHRQRSIHIFNLL